MDDKLYYKPFHEISPWKQLFKSLLIIIATGTILLIVLLVVGSFIFNSNINIIDEPAGSLTRNDTYFLKYLLMAQTFSFFLVPALIIFIKMKPASQSGYPEFIFPSKKEMGLVFVLAISMFFLTGFAGDLNSRIDLPKWLAGIGRWMEEMEEDASQLFDKLMVPVGFGGLIVNIFMIAVLPAIGEEMLFRGVLQKIFIRIFKSGHAAVWFTAVIFSAMHLQFMGFLPRLLLGLAFGYLFLWSGKLWLPVLAHFINNIVPVITSYIFGWEQLGSGGDIKLWQEIVVLPLPVFLIIQIMLYFRNKAKTVELIAVRDKSFVGQNEDMSSELN